MMKKIIFNSLIVILFSINVGAMDYDPGCLYSGRPNSEDASWDEFSRIIERSSLEYDLYNGGYISLSVLNHNYAEFQKAQRDKDKQFFDADAIDNDLCRTPNIDKNSDSLLNFSDGKYTVTADGNIIFIENRKRRRNHFEFELLSDSFLTPAFKVGDIVARINDKGPLYRLSSLDTLLKKMSVESACQYFDVDSIYLMIYFLFK